VSVCVRAPLPVQSCLSQFLCPACPFVKKYDTHNVLYLIRSYANPTAAQPLNSISNTFMRVCVRVCMFVYTVRARLDIYVYLCKGVPVCVCVWSCSLNAYVCVRVTLLSMPVCVAEGGELLRLQDALQATQRQRHELDFEEPGWTLNRVQTAVEVKSMEMADTLSSLRYIAQGSFAHCRNSGSSLVHLFFVCLFYGAFYK